MFAVGNQLKKVDRAGSPPQTLCDSPMPVGTGAWNQDGLIIFGSFGNGSLRRASAAGGVATDVTLSMPPMPLQPQNANTSITVVLNWEASLKKK